MYADVTSKVFKTYNVCYTANTRLGHYIS